MYGRRNVPRPLLVVIWTATSGVVTFDRLTVTVELVQSVSRGTDNLPANFGASATFLCRFIGKHASYWWCDVIILTYSWPRFEKEYVLTCDRITSIFYLWGHRVCRWCGSKLYSIRLPSLKFLGLPVLKIWPIFGHVVKRPGDLDLWPFDIGSDAECLPWNRQPSRQFCCFCNF